MEKLNLLREMLEEDKAKNEVILNLIEEGICGDFVEKISKSNRIFIYGKGISSSIVGQELKRAFTALGKYVFDFYKLDEIEAVLSLIREDDCMILMSLENSNDFLEKINLELENQNISRFFIGLNKFKNVPICTYNLSLIKRNNDEIYEGLESYSMLIRFLYGLCNM